MFLLDTNVVSELRRPERANNNVIAWASTVPAASFFLSAISILLAIDTAVAQRCARLHVPNPRAERDALIAATAMVHGLTVVTRNVADFKSIGVALLNPWLAQQGREG